MHSRPLRSLSALTFASALFLGLVPSSHAAGAKDKEAEKLFKSAIDEDYLNAEFPKAEKKLKDAVAKCGSDCSAELLGKIHIALGTVYGVGLSKPDDAKKEFVAAFKADPKAALDPSLTTPELTKIYEEAKKGAGSGTKTPDSGTKTPDSGTKTGEGTHTPPHESQFNTPLPLFVEASDEVPLSKVTLRYKPFGATQYKSLEMKKMGKGYGAEIPCEDLTTTGDVKYYFAFTGADGEAAGGLGSSKDPFKTTVKNEIEGDAPKLPGKKAPEQCKEKVECPPGLPGCEPVKGGGPKRGDKGWGSSCDQPVDCKEGLTCLNGTCEEDKGGGGGDKPDDPTRKRMNLVGLGLQLDVLAITGTNAACDGSNAAYTCFLQGTNNQFYGNPIPFRTTDGVQGGTSVAGGRILVGYDRQLLKKVALSIGARIGYAFGGPTSVGNSPPNAGVTGYCPPGWPSNVPCPAGNASGTPTQIAAPQAQANKFLPFHGELRLSYSFLGSLMEDKKFRPYVFVNGGVAQVNGSVSVALCDANVTAADTNYTSCKIGPNRTNVPPTIERTVDAYQITGLSFAGFGVGTTFGITPLFGIAAEFKFMFMFLTTGFVFAPSVGPVFNF